MPSLKDLPPFFAAVRRTVETCAEPGDCGEEGTEVVDCDGIELRFCSIHAWRRS